MGRTPDRLTPQQKDLLYELKCEGLTGDQVVARVEAGYEEARPFKVSRAQVNEIYRRRAEDEGVLYRTTIEGLTTKGALDKLTQRLLRLAEREIARMETRQRRTKATLDANRITKLAAALERIHKLDKTRAVPSPSKGNTKGPGAVKQSSFAAKLAEQGEQPEPIGDVVLPNGDDAGHASDAAPDPSSSPSIAPEPLPGTPDPAQLAPAEQSNRGEESVAAVPAS